MKSNKINVQEIVDAAKESWEKFGEGLDNNEFSKSERASLIKQLEEVEFEAYKAKLGIEMHCFDKTGEVLSSKDYLLKMLSILPKEVPVTFLPALTEYVLENWVVINRKVAA